MKNKNIFSITEFSRFTRTTRATLIHYDKIGLLSPKSRGDNAYRYYSPEQLAQINIIRTCQKLGVSLNEIQTYIEERSPENAVNMIERQIENIENNIVNFNMTLKLLRTLRNTIDSALYVCEDVISVKNMPATNIFMGEPNDYSNGRDQNDALLDFYHHCMKKYPKMDLNYSVWGLFSKERIKNRDWKWPDRYYFNNPDGSDRRPAGLYAIGYTRGGYGQTDDLYEKMLAFINNNNLEICGPTYEEYPLNEIAIPDVENYLIRSMITVRYKKD